MRITPEDLLKKLNITMLITAIIFMILPSAFAREEMEEYRLKEIVVVATKDPSPAQEIPLHRWRWPARRAWIHLRASGR